MRYSNDDKNRDASLDRLQWLPPVLYMCRPETSVNYAEKCFSAINAKIFDTDFTSHYRRNYIKNT